MPEVKLVGETVALPEPSGANGKVAVTDGLAATAVRTPELPPLDFTVNVAAPAVFDAVTVKVTVIV